MIICKQPQGLFMTNSLQITIDNAFSQRDQFSPSQIPADIKTAIDEAIHLLDTGKRRVAEKINGQWVTNEWLKKAVLLFFKTHNNTVINAGDVSFFDKVPLKFSGFTEKQFQTVGARVVPSAIARKEI